MLPHCFLGLSLFTFRFLYAQVSVHTNRETVPFLHSIQFATCYRCVARGKSTNIRRDLNVTISARRTVRAGRQTAPGWRQKQGRTLQWFRGKLYPKNKSLAFLQRSLPLKISVEDQEAGQLVLWFYLETPSHAGLTCRRNSVCFLCSPHMGSQRSKPPVFPSSSYLLPSVPVFPPNNAQECTHTHTHTQRDRLTAFGKINCQVKYFMLKKPFLRGTAPLLMYLSVVFSSPLSFPE